MKLQLSTSPKAIESANCVLGQAIHILINSEEQRKKLNLSITNVKDADRFRKSLLKSYFKQD